MPQNEAVGVPAVELGNVTQSSFLDGLAGFSVVLRGDALLLAPKTLYLICVGSFPSRLLLECVGFGEAGSTVLSHAVCTSKWIRSY